MILGVYPHGLYVGGDQWVQGRKTWGFEPGVVNTDYYPFEIVGQYAAQQGIPFINAVPAFVKAPAGIKYFHDWDGHMTPAGYAIVAQTILGDSSIYNSIENVLAQKTIMR